MVESHDAMIRGVEQVWQYVLLSCSCCIPEFRHVEDLVHCGELANVGATSPCAQTIHNKLDKSMSEVLNLLTILSALTFYTREN